MDSRRFPGKVLHMVAGKPLLQYLLERLQHSRCHHLVLATSQEASDTPIANFCRSFGVACYRGSLPNVASRFREVCEVWQFDAFIRISGDSPLLDQALIDQGMKIFCQGDFDIVTNVFPRTFPPGQSVELFSTAAFTRGYAKMRNPEDLEHVTPFFYRNSNDFKIFNFTSKQDISPSHLAVDTREDMEIFTAIIARMEMPHWQYHLEEIVTIYRQIARNRIPG